VVQQDAASASGLAGCDHASVDSHYLVRFDAIANARALTIYRHAALLDPALHLAA
jgi:hypothetical protein